MPITLADMLGKTARDAKLRALIWSLAYRSPILERLPFATYKALQVTALRVDSVEDAAFRQIGGDYSESTISPVAVNEGIAPLGGKFEIDRLFLEVSEDPVRQKGLQLENKFLAIKYKFHDQLINGDRAVDENGLDGLKKRIDALPSSQKIAGGGLDVSASAANQHKFIDLIDEGIDALPDDEATFIICNAAGKRTFTSVMRRLNLLDRNRDQYGREVLSYRGAQIVDIGTKGDQTTQIITSTETNDGSATTGGSATSFYLVRAGAEQYFGGIQVHPPRIIFDGPNSSKPTQHIVEVEWPCGIALWNRYSVARVHGVIPV